MYPQQQQGLPPRQYLPQAQTLLYNPQPMSSAQSLEPASAPMAQWVSTGQYLAVPVETQSQQLMPTAMQRYVGAPMYAFPTPTTALGVFGPDTSSNAQHYMLGTNNGNAPQLLAPLPPAPEGSQSMYILVNSGSSIQRINAPAAPYQTQLGGGAVYMTPSNGVSGSRGPLSIVTPGQVFQQSQQQQQIVFTRAPLPFSTSSQLVGGSNNSSMMAHPLPMGMRGSHSIVAGGNNELAASISHGTTYKVEDWGYAIADHGQNILQRVPIAPSAIYEETEGTKNYNRDPNDSSKQPCNSFVCSLFSEGSGCAQGKSCHAFHIKDAYLREVREARELLCCALHNCYYSREMLSAGSVPDVTKAKYKLRFKASGRMVDISVVNLSITVGLARTPCENSYRLIDETEVCRQNLDRKCKWTKDCKYVHVCPELWNYINSTEFHKFLDEAQRGESFETISRTIENSPLLRCYVRSKTVLPMVTQLLDMHCTDALAALVRNGVACVPNQRDALLATGLITSSNQVTHVDIANKVQPFLRPADTKATTTKSS